jgi:hypothetical protein
MNIRTRITPCVLVFVTVMSAALSGQGARPRPQRVDPLTASIRGTVTTASTGAPVRGAIVHLMADGSGNRLATTDSEGHYELTNLPAGTYRLTVSRAGFSSLQFGQRRPFETPSQIELSEGERVTANLALPRAGVIYGRVLDRFGEPVAGTRVQALRARVVQGQRRMQVMGAGDQTDDTGAYRLYGLAPGDYFVAASVGEVNAVRRDPPIYYPGTPSFAEAQAIAVAAGTEVAADFQLAPIQNARVSGVVLNSAGAPVEAQVGLVSDAVGTGPITEANVLAASAFRLMGDSGPDGAFTIENVPPGPYTLTASLRMRVPDATLLKDGRTGTVSPDGRVTLDKQALEELVLRVPETASMPLVVSGADISDITLVTRTGGVLLAQFEADDGVSRALPASLSASVQHPGAAGGMSVMQTWRGDGNFRFAGMSGPFHLDVRVPEGWALSKILVDGDDVTDEPIDLKGRNASARILVTDRITTVTGQVQSRDDTNTGNSVVVFPDDEAKWTYPSRYVRTARTDDRGRFQIVGLPPDQRYLALALDYLEDGEEQDPQFLERIRGRATSFSLNTGGRQTLQLDPVSR